MARISSILLVASAAILASAQPLANPPQYFFTFGDSYSQTGFDLNGTKPNALNPLGNPDLPGWTTTGGLNWIGLLISKSNASTIYSYNLASGGATTDAELVAPWSPTVLSLIDQTSVFSQNLASKPTWAPWTAQNTLVGVWMGVNDVGNTFWLEDREALIVKILGRYFDQLQILYDAGVRKFLLLGAPPTDKSPLMLENGEESNKQLAAAIAQYNGLIASSLKSFKAKNSGISSWIVDTAPAFNEAINNPSRYGAPDATCYNADGVSCLWYNNYHPGLAIHKLVAADIVKAVGKPWFV